MTMTTRFLRDFASDNRGNIAVTTALLALPLLSAIGLAVDYSSAISYRSGMQNALDAATISIMSLPKETTLADRKKKLQDFYIANGGYGTAKLLTFNINSLGSSDASTNAASSMKTSVMSLAGYSKVDVGVKAAAYKEPALVEASFEIEGVSGWWNKTMSVYGVKFGESKPQKLLEITYVYNNDGKGKGYGTTKISTVTQPTSGPNKGKDVATLVQTQKCELKGSSSTPTCTSTNASGQTGKASIDVSQMDQIYLQMDIPAKSSSNPQNPGRATTLRTDDPKTSNNLYAGPLDPKNPSSTSNVKQMETGKVVDVFSVVPCGQTSKQAWEDGGTSPPGPTVETADFSYRVAGKCDFSQRPFGITLTQ